MNSIPSHIKVGKEKSSENFDHAFFTRFLGSDASQIILAYTVPSDIQDLSESQSPANAGNNVELADNNIDLVAENVDPDSGDIF